ncbi:MAG TPA: molybdopterin-dependent oxidoreductase [Aggregatilineales bacterium]|nr:molybdopterin-dependent oxidoreductase [Anaerolineales bacterium]HRE49223.1 molybdopterin-dependent oxidoreductase [Aggregatilineales bacterium]
MPNERLSRRKFLIGLVVAVAGCRPGGRAVPTLYTTRSPNELPSSPSVPPTLTAIPATLPPVPARVPLTTIERLYIMSFRGQPTFDTAAWRLTIDGLVKSPLTLSEGEIRALPSQKEERTLQCISNPIGGGLIGNVEWEGTPLAPLLARAGIQDGATHALFEAADGYTTAVPLSRLTDPDTWLVYGAGGAPLTPAHGYPLRLLIPAVYGQKQPKWITRITLTDQDRLGYWEQEDRGWSNVATVKTNSAIRQPEKTVLPFTAPIRLEGYAFGGGRVITAVEVRISARDQGESLWTPTRLIRPPSGKIWTWWLYDWSPPAPGLYEVAIRATDATGYSQTRLESGLFGKPFPEGTDAIHNVLIKVG